MTSGELAAAAESFRKTLPLPDDGALRAQLAQPILHDLVKILKSCCSEAHPLTTAKKSAGMFFMAAATGDGELDRLRSYDTLSDELRAQVLSAWEGVLAAMEPEQQPTYQYMSYCQAALAERAPEWFLGTSSDQEGFRFLQYFHQTTGAQLDINVGGHWFAIAGGLSAGPYTGGGWRDEMLRDLVTAMRRAAP